ncbi:MAG: thioredoxin fold domain-containing protein [Luteimonas sp.]|nr:thioredoxin fold domain-containing protein [Luteimonas sp.]MCW5605684.1 thioredoxin fold domain-containing protein [Burkholderiales bacterium]
MNSLRRLLGILLLLCSGLAVAQPVTVRDAMTHFFDANTGDLRAELADAKAAGKKAIMLMYEQEGCPACLYMKQNVLNRSDVQALYHKYFVNFTIDLFGAVPLKDFRGRDITEKAFAAEARVRATPTFAFHDLAGAEVVRITGAVRNIEEFKLLAEFVASGAYRKRTFAEHRQLHLKKGG